MVNLDLSAIPPAQHAAALEYHELLATLKSPSQRIIYNLTKIAQENSRNAAAVALAISAKVFSAHTADAKLAYLYLADSIIKKVASVYVPIFSRNLISLYQHVYSNAPHSSPVRSSLRRLLETWPSIFGHQFVQNIRNFSGGADSMTSGVTQSGRRPGSNNGSQGRGRAPRHQRPNLRKQPRFNHHQSNRRPQPDQYCRPNQPKRSRSSTQAHLQSPIAKRNHYHRKRTSHQAIQGAGGSFGNGTTADPSTTMDGRHQQGFPRRQGAYGWSPIPSHDVIAPNSQPYMGFVSIGLDHAERLLAGINNKISAGIAADYDIVALRRLIADQLRLSPPRDIRKRFLEIQTSLEVGAPKHDDVVLGTDALKNLASILSLKNTNNLFSPLIEFAHIRNTPHQKYVGAHEKDLPYVSKSDNIRFSSQEELRAHLDWLFDHNRSKRARKSMDRACLSRGWYMKMDAFIGDDSASVQPSDNYQVASDNTGKYVKANSGEESCPSCHETFTPFWHEGHQEWLIEDAVRNSKGALFHISCAHSIEDIHRFQD